MLTSPTRIIPAQPTTGTTQSDIWDGLKKQSPLNSASDYFEASLDLAKWSEWDVAGDSAVTVSGGAVHLLQTSSVDDDFAGIVQVLPADNQFCITARMRLSGLYGTSTAAASLVIGEDLIGSPSTASFFLSSCVTTASGIFWQGTSQDNYTTFSAIIGSEDIPAEHVLYLRFFVDRNGAGPGSAEVTMMASADGRTWVYYPVRPLAGTVVSSLDTAGIATANLTGEDVTLHCDMFRLDLTSDPFFEVGGFLDV